MIEDRSILKRAAPPPDETVSYGSAAEQLADVRCGSGSEARPLLVLVHGGFWRPDTDRAHLASMSVALAGAGYAVATIEYRRIPGDPAPTVGDVRQASERLPPALRSRHDGRVILVGHSAGGHLVLWMASQVSAPDFTGVLGLAPVADLELGTRLNLGAGAVAAFLGPERAQMERFDPRRMASPRIDTRIVHGGSDEVVPIAVSESYVMSHPNVKLVRLPEAGHFALIDPASSAWPAVIGEVQRLTQ